MNESMQFSWTSLETLIPLCFEFCNQFKRGEDADLRGVVDEVGKAFGINDVDSFVDGRIRNGVEGGLNRLFDGGESKELAKMFASMCKPVAEAVIEYAKGEKNAAGFTKALGNVHLEGAKKLKSAFLQIPGVPEEGAEVLAKRFGPYLISFYCFSAAYKIYRKAAQDAELARMRRMEIERLSCEAIEYLKAQRTEMEHVLSDALLSRLIPFGEAVEAMDEAVLSNDDDAFVAANSDLRALFGGEIQYRNKREFDGLMLSDEAFRL